jgi:hypothetical protein
MKLFAKLGTLARVEIVGATKLVWILGLKFAQFAVVKIQFTIGVMMRIPENQAKSNVRI